MEFVRHLRFDFSNYIAHLSHSYQWMKDKTGLLEVYFANCSLPINSNKPKMIKNQHQNNINIRPRNSENENHDFQGNFVNKTGGPYENIKVRIGQTRKSFNLPKNAWKLKEISLNNKIRIFNTNVKSVFLYGLGTCRKYWFHSQNSVLREQIPETYTVVPHYIPPPI